MCDMIKMIENLIDIRQSNEVVLINNIILFI